MALISFDAGAAKESYSHDVVHEKPTSVCRAPSSSSTSACDSSVDDESDCSKAPTCFDSDEEIEREADIEPDVAASIERHLEAMNAAAEEVNVSQEAIKKCAIQRDALEQSWAITSARLATSVGMDGVAKAAPYFKQLYQCEAAREEMERATIEYRSPMPRTASAQRDSAVELEAKLAACVAKHDASKQMLKSVKARFGLSRGLLEAVLPYFEAEEEHRTRLEDVSVAIKVYQRRLDASKLQYSSALRSLEAISERAHTQRALNHVES